MSDVEAGYQGVEPGDLVFHALDGFAGAIGVSDSRGKCTPVYHVCDAPLGDDLRFVAYSLRAMGTTGFLALQAGTVRQRSVDFRPWESLARIPFPRPPLEAQRALGEKLDSETARIDALIGKKRIMIALLGERRVALTDSVILTRRAPTRPVAALATYINGFPFKPGDFTPDGLPVIRIRQLVDPSAELDYFNGVVPDRARLRDGDLVFSWSGSLEARLWDRGPAILNQHLFRVIPSPGVDKSWLLYVLDTSTRLFDGLMHGSAMTHITKPMMKDVRVPLPPGPEQRDIGRTLDAAWQVHDLAVESLRKQINLLDEHRDALITAAVTGQLGLAETA
ncbi:MAG TPA: restriction endonuclease subunit S [Gaiellaceae bacterium]|nr:restriction endonuclease subunit S [Gaiellaceae bacterium]